jgi:hypothetical protein
MLLQLGRFITSSEAKRALWESGVGATLLNAIHGLVQVRSMEACPSSVLCAPLSSHRVAVTRTSCTASPRLFLVTRLCASCVMLSAVSSGRQGSSSSVSANEAATAAARRPRHVLAAGSKGSAGGSSSPGRRRYCAVEPVMLSNLSSAVPHPLFLTHVRAPFVAACGRHSVVFQRTCLARDNRCLNAVGVCRALRSDPLGLGGDASVAKAAPVDDVLACLRIATAAVMVFATSVGSVESEDMAKFMSAFKVADGQVSVWHAAMRCPVLPRAVPCCCCSTV